MGKAVGIVSLKQFIEKWANTNIIKDVCEKLGITKQNAYARATKYRSDGVPLQKFVGGGGRAKVTLEEKLKVLARVRGTSMEQVQSESEKLMSSKEKADTSTEG